MQHDIKLIEHMEDGKKLVCKNTDNLVTTKIKKRYWSANGEGKQSRDGFRKAL